jgi:hypothetical protein
MATRARLKALARLLAEGYRDRVLRIRYEQGLSAGEAVAKADEPCSLSRAWQVQDCPPEEVSWADLDELHRKSPGLFLRRWGEIRRAAGEWLRGGEYAAATVEGRDSQPWRRALALAVREKLADGWQPRNGIERQLIARMAQAQAMENLWLERLPLLDPFSEPDAADKVGAMVDRFHRMFMRTLRALHDLRKLPPAVFVQNAGQVNVGQQQVNLAPQVDGRNGAAKSCGEERLLGPAR